MAKDLKFLNEYRTEGFIADELRMLAQAFPRKAQVLVEGEYDLRLYEMLFDPTVCIVVAVATKDAKRRVIATCSILAAEGTSRRPVRNTVGIVDSDFDHILNRKVTDKNVVYTDGYSLESMLIRHCNLEGLLSELLIDRRRLEADLLDRVVRAAGEVGVVRLANARKHWGLKFSGVDIAKYLDPSTVVVRVDEYLKAVIANTDPCNVTVATVQASASTIDPAAHDPWHLANGHDLVAVLATVLRYRTTKRAADATDRWLGSVLRLSYRHERFRRTQTWKDICEWERQNEPYTVRLRAEFEAA